MFAIDINDFLGYGKTIVLILVIFVAFVGIVSSDFILKYITRNFANATKNLTTQFKQKGMDQVEVVGKVSLGVVSFKVKAIDAPKNKKVL